MASLQTMLIWRNGRFELDVAMLTQYSVTLSGVALCCTSTTCFTVRVVIVRLNTVSCGFHGKI
jgi:hypothetical protein